MRIIGMLLALGALVAVLVFTKDMKKTKEKTMEQGHDTEWMILVAVVAPLIMMALCLLSVLP